MWPLRTTEATEPNVVTTPDVCLNVLSTLVHVLFEVPLILMLFKFCLLGSLPSLPEEHQIGKDIVQEKVAIEKVLFSAQL